MRADGASRDATGQDVARARLRDHDRPGPHRRERGSRVPHRVLLVAGVALGVVERAIANSLSFGLLAPDGSQAGFARAITDRATYAYLADVYVLEEHRGRGLGKWLVQTVLEHPDLQGLRRWALATADAHRLYARFGFGPPRRPEMHMFRE